MGAMFQGFAQGIAGSLQQKHDEEEALKKEKLSMYQKIMGDTSGAYSDQNRTDASKELEKLLNPEARKTWKKLSPVFNHIMGKAQQQPGGQQGGPPMDKQVATEQGTNPPVQAPGQQAPPQAPLQGQPAQQAPGGGGQPMSEQAPGTQPGSQNGVAARKNGFMNFNPAQARQEQMAREKTAADQEDARWTARQKTLYGLKTEEDKAKEAAKAPKTEAKTTVRLKLTDGTEVSALRSKDGKYTRFNGEAIDPDGIDKEAPKESNTRPTILSTDVVTVPNAQAMAEQGREFEGEDGKPISLDKIPKGMVLQAVHRSGKSTVYVPREVQDKQVNLGGVKYSVSPYEVKDIPKGAGTAIGQTNAPTSTNREAIVTDPTTGESRAVPLHGGRTPVPTGAYGRGAAPPPGGAPQASPQQQASPGGPPPPRQPQAAAPSQQPAPGGGAGRPIGGMPSGAYTQALGRVTPVREAAVQLLGDPDNPEMKSLADFSSVADAEPSRKANIGKTLNLIFSQMDDAAGGAHISASAGPISASTGGIGTVLQNYFGVPQKVAEQKAQIINKAIESLNPADREYVNATIASFSTVVGLRALTKGIATQSTVKSLERDIPLIGINVSDKKGYDDKMGHLKALLKNGVKGSEAVFGAQSPALLKRIQGDSSGPPKGAEYVRKAKGPGGHEIGQKADGGWYDMQTGKKVQ